jgi:hypothetical protein
VPICAAKLTRSQPTGVRSGEFRGGARRAGRLARVGEYFSRRTGIQRGGAGNGRAGGVVRLLPPHVFPARLPSPIR